MPMQLTTDSMLVVANIALDAIKRLLDCRNVNAGVAALEQVDNEHTRKADLRTDQDLDEICFGHQKMSPIMNPTTAGMASRCHTLGHAGFPWSPKVTG